MEIRLIVKNLEITLRPGSPEDIPLLLSFIKEMAAFEKLEVTATEASLNESLFGSHPAGQFFIVHCENRPIAYITYFFTFSSMLGKRGLWLDDIYVIPEYRGKGIGKALMQHLAHLAQEQDCGRFEWTVLDWNAPAIGLYKELGAEMLDNWRLCRMGEAQIGGLASGNPSESSDSLGKLTGEPRLP